MEPFYNLSDLKKHLLNKYSSIICIGVGKNMGAFFKWLEYEKIVPTIKALIDNDINKQYTKIQTLYGELEVKPIEYLKLIDQENTLVVVTPKNNGELLKIVKEYWAADIICFTQIQEMLNREMRTIPIINNKIAVFSTEPYAGHEKYIVQELLKLENKYDIVIISDCDKRYVMKGVRFVSYRDNIQAMYELSSAHVLIDNWTYGTAINKKNGQVLIEVKHWSSITLKTFGYDVYKTHNNKNAIANIKRFGSEIDYVVTGSDFDRKTVASGFQFSGQYLDFGSPRSDVLFSKLPIKEQFCDTNNIDRDVHFILYAPTFRYTEADNTTGPKALVELDIDRIRKSFEKKYGGIWYILLRLHHLAAMESDQYNKKEKLIDVSHYLDSQELVAISDIVITDYSSIMFEPAYVGKPVFLLASDRTEYLKKEREFLLDYDDLPFPKAESNDELDRYISEFDIQKYKAGLKAFLDKYGIHEDGYASKRTAKFIAELIENARQ